MRKKIFPLLFAIPFLGVGVWMLISASSSFIEARHMQGWAPVPAQLSNAGVKTHSGDDADTYEAFAEYSYRYDGNDYRNDRVGIMGGADNIGDYQVNLGRRLRQALSRGEEIEIYVNPDRPRDSVIDRDVRWSMIGFKGIFVLVFGGIGLGLIIYVLRSGKPKDAADSKYIDRPWLLNDAWQSSTIKSGSKSSMYFTWGFAAFWNLISAPLPFIIYREVAEQQNTFILIALLFPLVGIGMIIWAIRRTLEWRRFGAAPVELDPFPGAIGGHAGGSIDIRLPFDPNARFKLTLTSIYSYISGTGKNRSRHESAKWQDMQVVRAEPGTLGTRLTFRFDVPAGLTESDAGQEEEQYYLWRLSIEAELEGVDFDRDYEIPVYPTGEESRFISEHQVQRDRGENEHMDDLAVAKTIRQRHGDHGIELYYPAGRHLLSSLIGAGFGSIFAAIGWFLVSSQGLIFFGSVFGGIGLLAALGSLYVTSNSLLVASDGISLSTVRRVLGMPVRRQRMRRSDFLRFSKKSGSQVQTGRTHIIYYSVYAEDSRGGKILVGEGFKGEGEASAAIRLISRVLGLEVNEDRDQESATGQDNLLAPDS